MEQTDNPSHPMPGYYYGYKYLIKTLYFIALIALIAFITYFFLAEVPPEEDQWTLGEQNYLSDRNLWTLKMILIALLLLSYATIVKWLGKLRFRCNSCKLKTVSIDDHFCKQCDTQISKPAQSHQNAEWFTTKETFAQFGKQYAAYRDKLTLIRYSFIIIIILMLYATITTFLWLLPLALVLFSYSAVKPDPKNWDLTCPHDNCEHELANLTDNFCPNCGGQLKPTFEEQTK